MKKLTFIVAICMAIFMAAPAMALDVNMSGYYWVRGQSSTNVDLSDGDATMSFMSMKYRLKTVFQVHDNLKLTTRFDTLDNKRWGDSDLNLLVDANDNIDWDRAYMQFNTGIGDFKVGRAVWFGYGTAFMDDTTEADQIVLTKAMENVTVGVGFVKASEGDDNNAVSDQDQDRYVVMADYATDTIKTGAMVQYWRDNSDPTMDVDIVAINPYVTANMGNIAIESELWFHDGDADSDVAGADYDIEGWAFNLQGSIDLEAAELFAGFGYASGDDNSSSEDEDVLSYQNSGDWCRLFLLANNDTGVSINGAGVGYLTSGGNFNDGFKLFYGGVNVPIIPDTLKASLALGYGLADEEADGWDDEYGTEVDLNFTYTVMDNLVYKVVFAYLDAGDYFQQGVSGADVEDNFTVFNELRLKY